MEEATMTKAAKFVTFIPYMGLFPVLRSKGQGGLISFPRKSTVFIRPEHQIHPPAQLPSK